MRSCSRCTASRDRVFGVVLAPVVLAPVVLDPVVLDPVVLDPVVRGEPPADPSRFAMALASSTRTVK
jgi:hypothetical protein